MATMSELSIPQIKRLLRACDVAPTSVLAAKTKIELVELAGNHGIVQVPDEWTMEMIKQENDRRRAIQMKNLSIDGLADEYRPLETGSLSPALFEVFGGDLSPVSTQRTSARGKSAKAKKGAGKKPPPPAKRAAGDKATRSGSPAAASSRAASSRVARPDLAAPAPSPAASPSKKSGGGSPKRRAGAPSAAGGSGKGNKEYLTLDRRAPPAPAAPRSPPTQQTGSPTHQAGSLDTSDWGDVSDVSDNAGVASSAAHAWAAQGVPPQATRSTAASAAQTQPSPPTIHGPSHGHALPQASAVAQMKSEADSIRERREQIALERIRREKEELARQPVVQHAPSGHAPSGGGPLAPVSRPKQRAPIRPRMHAKRLKPSGIVYTGLVA